MAIHFPWAHVWPSSSDVAEHDGTTYFRRKSSYRSDACSNATAFASHRHTQSMPPRTVAPRLSKPTKKIAARRRPLPPSAPSCARTDSFRSESRTRVSYSSLKRWLDQQTLFVLRVGCRVVLKIRVGCWACLQQSGSRLPGRRPLNSRRRAKSAPRRPSGSASARAANAPGAGST